MKITRRDILKLAAGSAAGLLFTPVPWKTLDDTAIWTQNWPWIPRPAGGEGTYKFSSCTLCPAGCGLRARCINGTPVSLAGIAAHPYGNGSLCAVGLAAHHLPFHPSRVRQPLRRVFRHGMLESSPLSREEAVAVLTDALGAGNRASVAVLDQRPDRSVSSLYRRWLAGLPHGSYVVPPAVEDGTVRKAGELTGSPMGLDFEHARTILSVGTPLFEGWGTPGRMMRLAAARRTTGEPYVLQAESRQSQTAQAADRWIPLNPGTELALALGLSQVLIHDGLAVPGGSRQGDFVELAREYTPEQAAAVTGVPASTIVETARFLAAHRPAVVLGGGDAAAGPLGDEEQAALVLLNGLLGSVGTPGGLLAREPQARTADGPCVPEQELRDIPEGSLDVLILDSAENGCALPWKLIEPKLRSEDSLVVSLSPFLTGLSRHAGLIIPAPVPLERWEDIPAPPNAPAASLALSAPLFTPPDGAVDPIDLVQLLERAGGAGTGESPVDLLRKRIGAIAEEKRGRVFAAPGYTPAEPESADQIFSLLAEGGVWIDVPEGRHAVRQPVIGTLPGGLIGRMRSAASGRAPAVRTGGKATVAVVPFGVKGTVMTGQLSPILSKIFHESGLRPSDGDGAINPVTCQACGLKDGDIAELSTPRGRMCVRVHSDPSVMPGLLQVALGPDPAALNRPAHDACSVIDLCLAEDGTWRIARTGIGRANHG